MAILTELTGQVLDQKYLINKRLGEGGMGAVYRATHLGTERPVALKVIAPQFMANSEFVERFKREARAAGRLRHPNVVNVTDFGFAEIRNERFAYLVMEYLDGCSLGEVLDEEGHLPLSWAVDILEQICSAISDAHQQGIIHRDLKPDNIWLEPNRRGGYTVKVLDFGLAKLADPAPAKLPEKSGVKVTSSALSITDSLFESPTQEMPMMAEDLKTVEEEAETRISEPNPTTNRLGSSSENFTRIGTVLGTPLYMSPEQCRGDQLDIRTDIYSLGVIAYQMLAGQPPFTGNMQSLIKQHIEAEPPPLREKRSDIPKPIAALVMSALAKSPAERPGSAAIFANALRARAEGAGALLRQAVALYGEHFPTFFSISKRSYIPTWSVSLLWLLNEILMAVKIMPLWLGYKIGPTLGTFLVISGLFANAFNTTVFAPIVAQLLVMPLRAVQIGPVFKVFKKRFATFARTALRFYLAAFAFAFPLAGVYLIFYLFGLQIRSLLGALLLLAIALAAGKLYIDYLLFAPTVVVESKQGYEAMQRSRILVDEVRSTLYRMLPLYILVPMLATLGRLLTTQMLMGLKMVGNPHISDMIFQLLSPVIAIVMGVISVIFLNLLNPLIAIALSLLYLKARQAGGETFRETLSQFETEEQLGRSRWQLRISERVNFNNSR